MFKILATLVLAVAGLFANPVISTVAPVSTFGGSSLYTYKTGTCFSVSVAATGSGSLSYLWSETSGPSILSLTNSATTTVLVCNNNNAGSYVLNIAVTDLAGTTNQTIKIGSVCEDAQGQVILSCMLAPDHASKVNKLLGKLSAVGRNISPRADERNKAALDSATAHFGPSTSFAYVSNWYSDVTAQPGTVSITGNSAVVTGSGTTLKDLCNGGTTPRTNAQLAINYTGKDSLARTFIRAITGCTDNTHVTMAVIYPLNVNTWDNMADCDAGCSNLHYAYSWDGDTTGGSIWTFPGNPVNYYEGRGIGNYSYCYRSGIDDYCTRARTEIDAVFNSPIFDRGTACDFLGSSNYNSACLDRRSKGIVGLSLRMLDRHYVQHDDTDTLPGLKIMYSTALFYIPGFINDETREEAYSQAAVAACAISLVSIDDVLAATCRSHLESAITSWETAKDPVAGIWNTWYSSAVNSIGNSNTATLTLNSAVVTFNAGCPALDNIIFWSSGIHAIPTTVVTADALYFTLQSCSSGSGVLDRVYTGTTGAKGYTTNGGNGLNGNGHQPFMEGLLANSFGISARAEEGYSAVTVSYYKNAVIAIGNYIASIDYKSDTGGLFYFSSSYCGNPISLTATMCTAPTFGNYEAYRSLNAEVLEAIALAYEYTLAPALKTFGDLILGEMFNKPFTGGLTNDSFYISQWDDGGFYISGAFSSTTGDKFAGQFFGWPCPPCVWSVSRQGLLTSDHKGFSSRRGRGN